MSATTLFSIGEALIDMIPSQSGCAFAEVPAFRPRIGGAPANVCGAFAALGGRAALLTQLGDDPFGHKIARELAAHGIDVSRVPFTRQANTALAFVALGADGNRTFSFYRNPSADLLYSASQIDPAWFRDAFALHFCSVSLVESPMKAAHDAAIHAAGEAGAIISFDPNLRFPLWPDHDALRRTVLAYLPRASVLKISDEELAFLTGAGDIEAALPSSLQGMSSSSSTPAAAGAPTPIPGPPMPLPRAARSRLWTPPEPGTASSAPFCGSCHATASPGRAWRPSPRPGWSSTSAFPTVSVG